MKEIDWTLIAKKAWETRRKNHKGQKAAKKVEKKCSMKADEKLSDVDKMMFRIARESYVVGDEEYDKLRREMARKMRRKTLMERALGVASGSGIEFGKAVKKFKIERWNGGVRIGA